MTVLVRRKYRSDNLYHQRIIFIVKHPLDQFGHRPLLHYYDVRGDRRQIGTMGIKTFKSLYQLAEG